MAAYNVAIIGAGPGGYVAAIRCAQLGLKTVVIEKKYLGGTCLNVGCIPTKTLVHNAEILRDIRQSRKRGIIVTPPEVNMVETLKMKNRVVSQLTSGIESLLKSNQVTIIKGEAIVKSEHALIVTDEEITFENLIIATGSSNAVPPIPGVNDPGILTSTEMLEIDHVPESLCIIGGGVIGCEFATIFSNFGSKITIVEMMPNIIPMMDKDVSATLQASLEKDGITVRTGSKVTEINKVNEKYSIRVSGNIDEMIIAEKVLLSVGRKPNSFGFETLKLDTEKGYIKTDSQMRTNIANIYAIGDITGKIQLAHVASTQAIIAAENIAGLPSKMDYHSIPSCIYSIPEIGSVGMTEEDARQAGYEIVTGKFPMSACGRAKAMSESVGFTKIVAQKDNGRILGGSIVGPNATEIIGELAYIIQTEGTLEDIKHTVHAHPTICETILESAHIALGEPINAL